MIMEIKTYRSSLLCEEYTCVTHESGLRIYLLKKDMTTSSALFSVKFGGSVTEYFDGEKNINIPLGCAHFLEHKLFDNEDGVGADDVFSMYGAYDNAYTGNDRTTYLFNCTDNFEECLDELLKFVTRPYFTDASVKKEIGIIAEEIRGCMDEPSERCYMNMMTGLYASNPVKNEICGTEESISEITPELLYKLCSDFYRPENMLLCISGNVELDTVLRKVNEILPNNSKQYTASLPTFSEGKEAVRARTEVQMSIGKPIFSIGIKDTVIPSDNRERLRRTEAINMICRMLFSESEDFYRDLLERGLISPTLDSRYSCSDSAALAYISGECDDPYRVYDEILTHIEDTKQNGFDLSTFTREKRSLYASYVYNFDSAEDITYSLLSFADYDIPLFDYIEILESIDIDYVNSLLREVFASECFTLSVVMPIKK